jgi:hypothetical protein
LEEALEERAGVAIWDRRMRRIRLPGRHHRWGLDPPLS